MTLTPMKFLALLLLATSLSGCLYGQCMEGPCALERERILKSIKLHIEYWEKDGMTPELRQRDSVDCRAGGVTAGGIYGPEFDKARLPDEKEHEAYRRLFDDWERCMLKKGYHFTGTCYDNEIGRTSPACAGRALKAAELSLAQFLEPSGEGKKMSGATGGIQAWKGTLFGVPYMREAGKTS